MDVPEALAQFVVHHCPAEACGQAYERLLAVVQREGWTTPAEVDFAFVKSRLWLEVRNYRHREKRQRLRQRRERD
jgi:hypothetical protein